MTLDDLPDVIAALNLPPFTPNDWFWIIGGDETRAWSSAASGYVSEWPEDKFTRIGSEAELSDVLKPYNIAGPIVTQSDYAAAIQAHVDTTAKSRGYGDGYGLASYVASTVSVWAAEAQTFVAWRDAVWLYAYGELAKVEGGLRAPPTVSEIIAELPLIEGPQQ